MEFNYSKYTEDYKRKIIVLAKSNNNYFNEVLELYMKKYYRLITSKYYLNKIGDKEDIVQTMRIGIWKGVKYFNPSKATEKVQVDLIIKRYIECEIITLLKFLNRKKHSILNYAQSEFIDEEKSIFNILKDDFNIEKYIEKKEEYIELKYKVNEILSKLTDQEKIVFKYKLNGFTPREISMKTGLTTKQIDNAYQRIKKKSKNNFSNKRRIYKIS